MLYVAETYLAYIFTWNAWVHELVVAAADGSGHRLSEGGRWRCVLW